MIAPEMKTPPADTSSVVTSKYTEAYNLNVRICVNAQIAQQNLYEVCKGLKEMRNGKLYKELGYSTFEDYTENEVGLSRFMAYKYAAIADIKNVESIQQIGVTKLSLLAKLDEPQREEIQQNVDLESTSVRELKEKIDSLKKTNDRLMSKVDEAEKNAEKSRKSEEAACGKLSILQTDTEFQKQKIAQLESEISRKEENITALEEQVEQLENRPIEVAVESNSHEVENLMDAMKRVDLDWSLKYSELQEETTKETIRNNQEHTAEIERLKAEYEEKLANAEPVSDSKAVFKAYLSNAVDAVKRLAAFVQEHPDEVFFRNKTREFFENINKSMEV